MSDEWTGDFFTQNQERATARLTAIPARTAASQMDCKKQQGGHDSHALRTSHGISLGTWRHFREEGVTLIVGAPDPTQQLFHALHALCEAKYKIWVLKTQASSRIFNSRSGVFMTALPCQGHPRALFWRWALQSPVQQQKWGSRRFKEAPPLLPQRHALERPLLLCCKGTIAPKLGTWNAVLHHSGGLSGVPWHSSLIPPYNSEES